MRVIGVLAWSACDYEGRRRLVAVKTKEMTLVASEKPCALMRTVQDEEYQELREAIEYANERQGKLLAAMQRKQKLMGEVAELRETYCQEIRVEEEELEKQAMKGLLREGEKTPSGGLERHSCYWEWGRPDGSSWVSKLRSGGDFLLSDVGVLQQDTEEDQRSCGPVKAPSQKRREQVKRLKVGVRRLGSRI